MSQPSVRAVANPSAPPGTSRWIVFAAGALVVLATLLAYQNGLRGPFVFDDFPTIVENPTIRRLSTSLMPPSETGLTVNGRPVVNFSLALNYAFGGIEPRGYHATNLAIHTLAALLLFGVVRRTLLLTRLQGAALPLALAIAGIWAVHPLQTAAVTYVVQRSESLLGLFYLLTLYAFIRGAKCHLIDDTLPEGVATQPIRRHGQKWLVVSVAACALGMATKEVMVSAPLMVLLYDRTFVAGSFGEAWRRRWRFYLALGATWLLLAWLMLGSGARGGTAGFGLGVTGWDYAVKQCDAVVHYLRLAFWPKPLVFDYGGMVLVPRGTDVWPQALLLGALAAGTGFALWRGKGETKPGRVALGFMGIWFFAILAPTSSVVPLADTMFEHRMYLPLAAIVTLAVVAIHRLLGRGSPAVFAILVAGLGAMTTRRNADYQSELTLWRDTVAKRPENVRAHYTFGSVLFANGQVAEAIAEYEAALQLKPDSAPAHNNLGNALLRTGRIAQALPHYEAALRTAPRSAETHNNLGNALVRLGRAREARAHYETALQLERNFADAHNNLGNVLAQAGEFAGAAKHFEAALHLRPDLADAHANLGNVLAQSGRAADALPHYEAALRLRPNFVDAHYNFAMALTELRRWPEAAGHYETVLKLRPDHGAARDNLARVQALIDVHGR
ncbi:MAG TPA: tetratricopeptide repeat protein [Opitutaceae bacterium]|nr:tetratricopeptide repeat protein [Opitutaceae bacterium]